MKYSILAGIYSKLENIPSKLKKTEKELGVAGRGNRIIS